jgi:hypothetical protein
MTINVNRDASGFLRALAFHEAMGLRIRPIVGGYVEEPTVEERILRAKLLLEETLETIEKGLGLDIIFLIPNQMTDLYCVTEKDFQFEVARDYDPVETLDGLADIKVIANGTAVQFGLPMEDADREVFESNMSKLDEDGLPNINECVMCSLGQPHGRDICTLIDPTQPVGKVLKGPNFRKPDIEGLLR